MMLSEAFELSITRREFLEALTAAILAGIPLHTRAGDAAAPDESL
jgi:hypothetical protein